MYSDRGSVLHHKPKIENVMLHKQALNLLNTPRIVWKEMQAKQREINVGSPKKNPAGRMDDKYGERMRCWFTSFVVPARVYDSDRSVKDGTKSEEPPQRQWKQPRGYWTVEEHQLLKKLCQIYATLYSTVQN